MPSDFADLAWYCLAAFGCAAVLSGLLTALLIRLAPHWGLLDHPAERKVHSRPTPKGGGLAIAVALVGTILLFPFNRTEELAVLGLGLVLVVLGLVDDVRPLPWQLRLVVQTGAAVVAVYFLPPTFGWPERALAVFWIVGLTNAFNMLDNMDALSGGVAWIAAEMFALVSCLAAPDAGGAASRVVALVILMGALSGFLWFNRPPARIFMGDAGSTFLGFFLGFQSLVVSTRSADRACPWAVPVCVLAVPWYDLTSVVLIRLSQGRSPFHADKQHLSHRLVELGLRSPTAVRVIYLLALASGLGGVVLYQLGRTSAAILFTVQVAVWWLALAAIEFGVRRQNAASRER